MFRPLEDQEKILSIAGQVYRYSSFNVLGKNVATVKLWSVWRFRPHFAGE